MSRKDRSTMLAVGMSSAVRDLSTKLRCAVHEEAPEGTEFPGLIAWYERRERERKEHDRVTRCQA